MGRALRTAVAAVMTAGLVMAGGGPASAHNVLTGSSPDDGTRLRRAPSHVTLTFNLPVRHGYDTIAVTGPGGGRYDTGRTSVDDRTVRVAMRQPGPAGRYAIGYRILSADGHPVSGTLHFTLTVAGPGKPAPKASVLGAARDDGDDISWLWIGGVTVLAMLVIVLLLRRARNARP